MIRLALIALLTATGVSSGHAQTVTVVPTEAPVTTVLATQRGAFIETTGGTFRLSAGSCDGGICFEPDVIRGLPTRAPDGALPDGFVATAPSGDIRRAYFAQPTDRYRHAILGDAIEGGSLMVETADGQQFEFVLPQEQVFEDITPRIHDAGGDGTNEVIAIRASRSGGGAVVVYGLRDGALVEIAASSENGRPNRWLNIAGITTNAGRTQIAFVRTPHIGGRLATLTYENGRWRERNEIVRDVSNHLIGARELDLSEVSTIPGLQGLVLPSQNWQALRIFDGDGRQTQRIDLPAAIDKAIIAVGNHLVTATRNGELLVITP